MPDQLSDAEIAARVRAGLRCQICRQERRPDTQLCDDHRDDLARILDPDYAGDRDLTRAASIPQLYARLDPTPASTGDVGPRPPGFDSQPPCDLHTITMRDDRSKSYPVVEAWYDPHPSGNGGDDYSSPHYEDENPPRAVHKVVSGVAETVWADMGMAVSFDSTAQVIRPGHEVEAWCTWLHQCVDVIAARDDAAEIHRDLTDLHNQLRPAAGDPKPQPVAKCTGWIRDPYSREKVECKAPLYLPPPQPGVASGPADPPKLDRSKSVMRCGRCDRPYTALQLLRAEIGEQRQAS